MQELFFALERYRAPGFTFQERLAYRERDLGIIPADQLLTLHDRERQYGVFEAATTYSPLMCIRTSNGVNIWVKVESENPFSESHYDRVTPRILHTLEQQGLIKPGARILEGTSGSLGRSFAYFCNRLGYGLDMIIPQELPAERRRDMKAFGANLIEADRPGGVGQVIAKYKRIIGGLRKECEVSQYELEGKPIILTPRAFGAIAEEVVNSLPEGVKIDTFIGTLGNGSTVKGITEVLRNAYGHVRVIGTETRQAPVNAIRKIRELYGDNLLRPIFREKYGFDIPERGEMQYHDSFGASTPGYEPPFVEVENIDEIVLLGNEWRRLHQQFNLASWVNSMDYATIGHTSAENLWVALQRAKRDRPGVNYLILFYDKADQYPGWPPSTYRPVRIGGGSMGEYIERTIMHGQM
jgi:cysteine synthase